MRRGENCLRLRQFVEEGVWESPIDMRAEQDPVQVENHKTNRKPLAAYAEASWLAQNDVQPCDNGINDMDRDACTK